MTRRGKSQAGRRLPSLSMTVRFGLISLALLAVVGLLLGRQLQGKLRDRAHDEAVGNAQLLADIGLRPLLRAGAIPIELAVDADAAIQLDQALGSMMWSNGLLGVSIWDTGHHVLYSDNVALLDRWFPENPALDRAIGGATVSAVVPWNESMLADENSMSSTGERVFTVFIPLRAGGDGTFTLDVPGADVDLTQPVVGAIEVTQPYAPIQSSVTSDSRYLVLALTCGMLVVWIGLMRLVVGVSRRLRRQAEQTEHRVNHDDLTGLLNRRGLIEAMSQALRADRGTTQTVALFDVDRFKELNDTLGHEVGDDVLRQIADRLRTEFDDALVARIGTDEFSVAKKGGDAFTATHLCDRIERTMLAPIAVRGIEMSVRASIGVALAVPGVDEPGGALHHADIAMSAARRDRAGRRLYSPDLDDHSPERLHLAAEMREAIDAGQLSLVFQPKLAIASCRVDGVEALVRWHHPERGILMPGDFLGTIENTELIGPLTWSVLDLALHHVAAWRRDGIELTVAINVSARTVSDPSLIEHVRHALQRHDVPGKYLELEITERAVLDDLPRARETLHQLQNMGVTLAVDDFGTGYASLNHLAALPLDVLKVDRIYVQKMFSDPTAAAVVRFAVDLARHLGATVVAEGVEDARTMAELLRLGCGHAQGHLIALPMPAEELIGWIHRWYAATGEFDGAGSLRTGTLLAGA